MLTEQKNMQLETRDNMRGGEGSVDILHAVPKEHLPAKARLFSLITLKKGCGVGRHEHSAESEVYYAISGEGMLDDNGTLRPFKKGDCHVCNSGGFHAVSNEREEPFVLIAAIILD